MSGRECPSCRKTVPPGMYGIRLECSHWVHTKCLDKKEPDFEKCAACKGDVDLNVPMVDAEEPTCIDGRDYVLEPVESDSYFTSKRGEPFSWLAQKKPIEWMIHNQGYGLQRMLQAGVKLDDFVKNGYTWEDLKVFRDFSNKDNLPRARDALFALRCNAEHFRDYSHLLGSAISDLGINGRHLVELYGFYFPTEGQPLSVVGGKNEKYWSANQLTQLGMKMEDLFGAGMETLDQYAHLEPTDADEKKLGTTDEDVAALCPPQQEKEELVMVAEPAPRRVVYVEPAPTPERYIVQVPKVVLAKPKMTRLHGLKPKRRN